MGAVETKAAVNKLRAVLFIFLSTPLSSTLIFLFWDITSFYFLMSTFLRLLLKALSSPIETP